MAGVFKPASKKEWRLRKEGGRPKAIELIGKCCEDFVNFARTTDPSCNIRREHVAFEVLFAPHTPPRKLPAGMACVCIFRWSDDGICMKTVKARTQREVVRQYDPKASGSLAKNVLRNMPHIEESGISDWIRNNTDLIILLLSAKFGIRMLKLFEIFVRLRWVNYFE